MQEDSLPVLFRSSNISTMGDGYVFRPTGHTRSLIGRTFRSFRTWRMSYIGCATWRACKKRRLHIFRCPDSTCVPGSSSRIWSADCNGSLRGWLSTIPTRLYRELCCRRVLPCLATNQGTENPWHDYRTYVLVRHTLVLFHRRFSDEMLRRGFTPHMTALRRG